MLISIAPVFLGAFLSWFKKALPLSVLLLIVGYAAALVSGFVQPIGIASVMVVALLAWLCSQTLDSVRGAALQIIQSRDGDFHPFSTHCMPTANTGRLRRSPP